MASMRCSMCNIEYPMDKHKCLNCESELWYNNKGEVDEMWQWKATKAQMDADKEAAEGANHQPWYLPLEVTEIIDVPDEGDPKAIPCLRLVDVYAHNNKKLLLRADDVVELPNPEWKADATEEVPMTRLYEVIGTFRSDAGSWYLLRHMVIPDHVPDEWVAEFRGH